MGNPGSPNRPTYITRLTTKIFLHNSSKHQMPKSHGSKPEYVPMYLHTSSQHRLTSVAPSTVGSYNIKKTGPAEGCSRRSSVAGSSCAKVCAIYQCHLLGYRSKHHLRLAKTDTSRGGCRTQHLGWSREGGARHIGIHIHMRTQLR